MSIDKQVIVWDHKTYERLCGILDTTHMYRPEDTFSCMVWDDQTRRLILCHSRLQAWPYRGDASEGLGLVLHKERIISALYNEQFGNIVTVDVSGLVIVWKIDDGQQFSAWFIQHGENEMISTAHFDRSGRRLLVGTSIGHVWIYNWNSGVRLNNLEGDMDNEVTCVLNTISAAKRMEVARGHTVATGWNKFVSPLPFRNVLLVLSM